MDTSLQSVHATTDDLSVATHYGAEEEEHEEHIHLPNPSLWPFILSAAILVTVTGLLFVPETPWLTLIGAPFVLVGILGWGLEDPMATADDSQAQIRKYIPSLSNQEVLDRAREVTEQNVTVASTAWSTHPVKVEVESEESNGVVLALYGKVELEAQREKLEETLRELPNVVDVKNYIVAEDDILNLANQKLANLQEKGKMDGAKDISILVENYILHLYGEVPKPEMKYALERELVGLPGVRVVVNHIGLDKNVPGNLGKTRNR